MQNICAGTVRALKRKAESLPARREAEHLSDMATVQFFHANGLRHVVPYVFTYKANAKERWFRRTLIDVLTDEFRRWTRGYYEQAILDGRIRVGNARHRDRELQVDPSYVLQSLDFVRHDLHKHEPSVCGSIINIVHETADFVVVDKPPSMPIHPCGNYRNNSLTVILEKELKTRLYRTCFCSC
jgi:23S rRNA-/tRNA-specific pseudouridylate synthase